MTSNRVTRRKIVIIGAGPGGLCMGIKLKEAGFDDFTILEQSGGVGGTWRHNSYPGCEVDVPSALFSFTFERKPDWSRPYARQPELRGYLEMCAEKYGLLPHLVLNTAVRSAVWSDDENLWRIESEDGRRFEADVMVSAVGMFNEPHWPDIPGLADFEGRAFHSARWDHTLDLEGRVVAVIGSAASAVQLVPEIAPKVRQLYLHHRTANWILPKDDTPFTAEQLEAFRTDDSVLASIRDEFWTWLESVQTFSNPEPLAQAEEAGRANLENIEDPALRALLTPAHSYGSRRELLSNDFYPTLSRANVEVLTTPIDHITKDGIVYEDGTRRNVDTLIFATGFETTKFVSAIDVAGRGGRRIRQDWKDGAQAYLGITTHGYPNLFQIYGPNTNNGSILYMLECQVDYTVRQIERLRDEGLAWVDVRAGAMADYNEELQRDISNVKVWQTDINTYYRSATNRIVTQYPHTMTEYRKRTSVDDRDAYEVCALETSA